MTASPETLPELPPYPGVTLDEVTLVRTTDDLRAASAGLLTADALGFDTESRPTFRPGEVSTGPHLIQLANDRHVFLFQVSWRAAHPLLAEVLASPSVLKAGFGLRDDIKRLRLKLGVEMANVLDLAVALRKEKRKDIGARAAVADCFGQRLQKSKSVSTSNWSLPELNERQIRYAADDALVALRVYRHWVATHPR